MTRLSFDTATLRHACHVCVAQRRAVLPPNTRQQLEAAGSIAALAVAGGKEARKRELPCDELALAPSTSSMSWNKGGSRVMNLLRLPAVSKGAWNERPPCAMR